MSADVSKGLEEALRAAMVSNGSGGSDGGGAPNDPLSLLMKVLPTLLENREECEDYVEMEKEDVSALSKDVRFVRLQLGELVKSHKGVLAELRLMQELQSTMVAHMARVQIIEVPDQDLDEDIDDELFDELESAEDFSVVDPSEPSARRRGGTSIGAKRTGRHKARPR